MQSFVYVACLLASLAAANPVEVERRGLAPGPMVGGFPMGAGLGVPGPMGFGVPGPIGGIGGAVSASSQQHQEQSGSSSMTSGGFAAPGIGLGGGIGGGFDGVGGVGIGGGFGGVGGVGLGGGFGGIGGVGIGGGAGGMSSFSSQSHSSSSSSFSYTSVLNSFQGVAAQIQAIQGMMQAGSFSQAIAMQQMTRLASLWQVALSQSAGCGCFGQGNFISSASAVFQQFYSLMTSMQSMFGPTFGSICQPFGGIGSSFQSFFQSFSRSGYQINSIVPPGFPSLMGNVIPGMTNMVGFK